MSVDQASPLVPIKPQIALQNSAFIKNSHNRSSFCGVTPSPTNGNRTFKTFAVNRKSWSGNVSLPLQQFLEEPPQLGTFRSGTGTFPRNRERNNNTSNGILTPNGNVQTFKGNEVRRSGCSNGRRYAEIGNWNKRNATFLEPHLQGVRRRDSRSSDSEHERSTEDDERSLIRSSPRSRHPPPDNEPPPPMKPREFFERLQSQAMKEISGKTKRDQAIKDANQLFRPLDTDGSLVDSLSQSRESLSSDGEGAKGDCSSVGTSGSDSEEQPPCDIGLLERLIRTHPVWFLPGIQRAGAFHLLQGKEEGNFVVRQSSQPDTMAISVRLPADKGPYIEHYLIQASAGRIGLETSANRFDNIPELIAHYSQCCDELPVQLQLPRPLRDAKSRHQLSSLALLGQEFWGYPMANPKNTNVLSPGQLASGVVPMAITPSDTGSSLSSFNPNTNSKERIFNPDKENDILKMSVDTSPTQTLSTFKGKSPPSPPAKPGSFVRAPRPTPPNTLNLMTSTAHITQPHTFPTTNPPQLSPTHSKSTPPPPPPRWAKPPFPTTQSLAFSPINKSNGITVTTTVTFSVNNTQIHNHQINENIQSERLQLTLANTDNAFNLASTKGEAIEQESDILESPGVYCRSSLLDKVSDYEDIWGPEGNNCTTFKPKTDNDNINNGLMKSKRPDLLPDTLPKLIAAKSTQSILDKENMILLTSSDSLEKKNLSDSSLKKSFNGSNEIIATTNSKGDVIPKRPDKLNIALNMNKKLTDEIEAALKNKNHTTESMETVKLEDDFTNVDGSEKDNAGSPFYADPVDTLKEAAMLPVQRRKLLRGGVSLSQRYSEPPSQNHPYYPLRDMHSIEELSPSSPNTSTSVDNLVSLRTKPKMKPVEPPRVAAKPPNGKEQTWAVDSSWQFINKNEDGGDSGTFPSLAEQETKLSADEAHLSVHQVVALRFPELRLTSEPTSLPEEVRSPPRASCYDNVHDLRPLSEQASDDGTVFSEPWDSSQWDGLLPVNGQSQFENEEVCEWESPVPRRGPAAAARAKSFRDRLDPLLAAGRVRALRGGRTSLGAGAALRAYALHLAQDKSTTFAQNVDNFIACTLDSKETCPQVMMRNMRQFMSGMKNYLVKHGEREFEKEVEKERLKLKPTEFLNIDAILEGVMHRLVVRPLRSKLYTLLASWHATDVRQLHAAIERAQHATALQLGVKESTKVPSSAVLAVISKHFLKMQEADSPLDKLENLLAAISAMFNAIRGERTVGADDLLPVLAWCVSRCRLVCAELEAELMAGLLPPALLAGEGGYYLTALFSAVAVLKRLAPEAGSDSSASCRRGSESSNREAAAVVRVALPDECRGWIRRVALPCRPAARVRDLCRALAHAAAITNPQDYALFALHDGHETMLNENDCPQEVMSEKSGQNFVLAYKRIDAKIAWPQQALLSYP
ncbi:protein sprint isoform X5 [Pieris brassicae]|uniref:protein sprint isoform X5 n=1 Tax=Pieris brassicae TaxID=7116 RepID=UPI001E6607BB|nr:protein sprint isoform X5 [Pieris brassicae]